jgi:hypothetical protein
MSKAPGLYRIEREAAALADLMADVIESGADDAAVDAIIESWLGELGESLAVRLDVYVQWRAQEASLVTAAKCEATRLAVLAKRREAQVDRVDAVVMALMQRIGVKNVDTPHAVVSVRQSGGKPAIDVDDSVDIKALPPDCVKTTHAPIKEALLVRLQAGENIDGVTIKPRGHYLSIK